MRILLTGVRAIALVLVATTALVGLEVVTHEVGLVRLLAHAEASDGDAVERVHVFIASSGVLALLRSGSSGCRARGSAGRETSGSKRDFMSWVVEIDVRWHLRAVALCLHEAPLQTDHVFAQRVVLADKLLELLADRLDVLDFFFKLANICFLALTESALSVCQRAIQKT